MLAQCNHKAVLLLETPGTAEWASKLFGQVETVQERRSQSDQGTTVSNEVVRSDAVLPSEFQSLKVTNPTNGLSGYYVSPYIGAWYANLPGDFIRQTLLPRRADILPDLEARPKGDQDLVPWTEADLKRLRLKPDEGPPLPARATSQGPPQMQPTAGTPKSNEPQMVRRKSN